MNDSDASDYNSSGNKKSVPSKSSSTGLMDRIKKRKSSKGSSKSSPNTTPRHSPPEHELSSVLFSAGSTDDTIRHRGSPHGSQTEELFHHHLDRSTSTSSTTTSSVRDGGNQHAQQQQQMPAASGNTLTTHELGRKIDYLVEYVINSNSQISIKLNDIEQKVDNIDVDNDIEVDCKTCCPCFYRNG
jgi:hypothetical protein